MHEGQQLRGNVVLVLRDSSTGEPLLTRTVHNAIMMEGSRLVASRMIGDPVDPLTAVGVGTSDARTGSKDLTDLEAPIGDGQAQRAAISLPDGQDKFVTLQEDGSATLTFEATFGPELGNGPLREAGVYAGDILYNRVTFEVITKNATHTLTQLWTITISEE